jgi:hypothetical protein
MLRATPVEASGLRAGGAEPEWSGARGRWQRWAVEQRVVDFTDAPLSEHPSRNTGLKLNEMLSALKVLASDPGLVAITLTELNPHNAASDDGLLERFAADLAATIN